MRMYWPFAAAAGELGSLTFEGGYWRASSAKTTGNVAISQKVTAICSGEYESMSAEFSFASVRARAREPGKWTVSASVNRSHAPRAARAPVITALFLPVQPVGRGPASITRTFGKEEAISRVRSVEWSLTTTISNETPAWETRDSTQDCRLASSFRAGMMMETCGGSLLSCPIIVSSRAVDPRGLKPLLFRCLTRRSKRRSSTVAHAAYFANIFHPPAAHAAYFALQHLLSVGGSESIIISGCGGLLISLPFWSLAPSSLFSPPAIAALSLRGLGRWLLILQFKIRKTKSL